MSFTIDTEVLCHLLPDDEVAAREMFLGRLMNPAETYMIEYGFAMPAVVDALSEAHASGVPLHLYIDHTQSAGPSARKGIRRLVSEGVEVTVGTSTRGAKYICHTKGMVTIEAWDPIGPWCWQGSVNISETGWKQVNTAMVYRSKPWADAFIAQFKQLRQFAWTEQRHYQVMSEPPSGVVIAQHS